MAVELGTLTLEKLTHIAVRERARIVQHAVPGLDGDLSQVLGRGSVEVELRGICGGAEAAEELERIRAAYRAQEPVDFFADATGSGYFSQVLIAKLDISQRAGTVDEFEFACEVVEFVEPPEPMAPDLLEELDGGILDEASGFMDDAQDGLANVSALADLASSPGFGDPTVKLKEMPEDYEAIVAEPSAEGGADRIGDDLAAAGNLISLLKELSDLLKTAATKSGT